MKFKIPSPQTLINITAGLIGLLFDELEGVTSEAQPDDLTKISGIGPEKLMRYGEKILEIVRDFGDENDM